jgi:hypothetical protein
MEDNYLWDGTGEPDPQIQELEQLLGKLRYQPQPLEIPGSLTIGRRRSLFPAMAIAAAVGLCAALIGLWLYSRYNHSAIEQARTTPVIEQKAIAPQDSAAVPPVTPIPKPASVERHRDTLRALVAVNKTRRSGPEIQQPRLTPQELAEKEQLVAALRLVSAKLNVAQRKTQGSPFNTIRNQHRIG